MLTYIHTYIHTITYIHTYIQSHTQIHTYKIHICLSMYVCVCMFIFVCQCIYIYIYNFRIYNLKTVENVRFYHLRETVKKSAKGAIYQI